MTNKVTMPEPVAYAVTNKRHQEFSIALHHDASFAESDNDFLIEDLITTTQAEAYANARVREALGNAADYVKGRKAGRDDQATLLTELGKIERVIRALIPAENKS